MSSEIIAGIEVAADALSSKLAELRGEEAKADDITSHRAQAAEIAQHAADVAKAAKAVKGNATFIAAALGVSPCWLAFGCEDRHGK